MYRKTYLGLCLAILLLPAAAAAQLVVDQEQPVLGLMSAGIGGDYDQRLAQTVTAGLDGDLTHVELAVGCQSGTLIVEIVFLEGDLPGTRVLTTAAVEAAALPPGSFPPPFVRIELSAPVRMSRGDRFAIVLRNDTGSCGIPLTVDAYPDGRAFYDALDAGGPRPRVWTPWNSMGLSADLAFRTIVHARSTGNCSVRGLQDPLPIPRDVPLCRCVQDAALREQRCTLLHPSLVLFRRLPFPLKPGEPFTVRWTLMPLAPLTGVAAVDDALAPGFDTSLKAPLWFFLDQALPGEAMTLEYSAVAPASGGTFQLQTGITLSDGTEKPISGSLRTLMPVLRAR